MCHHSPTFIFHIGYMKTASTYLQSEVFPKIDNLLYVNNDKLLSELFSKDLLHTSPLLYDKKKVKLAFSKLYRFGLDVLYSEEHMTGNLLEPENHTFTDTIKKISELNVKTKIILVMRNQETLILSLYHEYLKLGGRHNFKDFLYLNNSTLLIDNLFFHKLVNLLNEKFGKDNIKLLLYEDLVKNKNNFLSEFLNFVKKDEGRRYLNSRHITDEDSKKVFTNRSVCYFCIFPIRLINMIGRSRINPFGLFNTERYYIYIKRLSNLMPYCLTNSGRMEKQAKNFCLKFKHDNILLSKQYPELNLKEYGYLD